MQANARVWAMGMGALLTAACLAAGGADFEGVTEARVAVENGMPRLVLDGTPTPPFIFFYNTDVQNPKQEEYLRTQVGLAAKAGVHLYSLPFRTPMAADGVTPDWAYSSRLLDRFIEADPQALFILRLFPGPDWSWKEWKPWHETNLDHYARFADGSLGRVSIASDYLWEPSNAHLRQVISHYENSPYGKRILGWHPGAPDSELFHDDYRGKGPDYSPVNQARFRRWLADTYGTDAALRQAWGREDVSLAAAAVPDFEPGRFPMRGAGPEETVQVFYDLPGERDWVDFSAYSNDIVADRVKDWARLIKEVTGGRKLSVFFYGYTFELPGSFSGHYRLQRVLECPDVDVLVSPYSYLDRAIGGAGNFMTLVDTVTAHGKLWLNEDDTRTNLIDLSVSPNPEFLLGGKRRAQFDAARDQLTRPARRPIQGNVQFGARIRHPQHERAPGHHTLPLVAHDDVADVLTGRQKRHGQRQRVRPALHSGFRGDAVHALTGSGVHPARERTERAPDAAEQSQLDPRRKVRASEGPPLGNGKRQVGLPLRRPQHGATKQRLVVVVFPRGRARREPRRQ